MYPKIFSPLAAKQRFDFSYLKEEYSKKFIPVVDIDAFNEDEKTLEMSLDAAKAGQNLHKKMQSLQDKSFLIIFSIPSPFGSKETSGKTVWHAVSAIVDLENKKLFLQEPCYGEIGKNNQPIKFPYELKESLEHHFPDFKVIEHEEKLQKRGENICALAAIMRAKLFFEVNSYTGKRKEGAIVTRERLERDWAETMAFMNNNIPRDKYINYTSFALLADIKLALMQKFNIDILKSTLEYCDPCPPVSTLGSTFGQFQRFMFSFFNELRDDEKYQFLSKTFEFVNTSHRGELTEYGKMLIDKIADLVKTKYPTLFIPLDKEAEEEGIKVTHQIDSAFQLYKPGTRETSSEIQKFLQEVATLIRTYKMPAPLSDPQIQNPQPTP